MVPLDPSQPGFPHGAVYPADGPPFWAGIPLFALGVSRAVHHRGAKLQGRSTSDLVCLPQTSTSTTSIAATKTVAATFSLNQWQGASN
jgi:hypothetical protein